MKNISMLFKIVFALSLFLPFNNINVNAEDTKDDTSHDIYLKDEDIGAGSVMPTFGLKLHVAITLHSEHFDGPMLDLKDYQIENYMKIDGRKYYYESGYTEEGEPILWFEHPVGVFKLYDVDGVNYLDEEEAAPLKDDIKRMKELEAKFWGTCTDPDKEVETAQLIAEMEVIEAKFKKEYTDKHEIEYQAVLTDKNGRVATAEITFNKF